MAEDNADAASRTEAPSQRRLDEARRRGEVAKSPDVASFAALAAASAVLLLGGAGLARSFAESLLPFIAHPEAFDLTANGGAQVFRQALRAAAPVLVVLAAAGAAGAAGNFAQQGVIWAPSKLAPEWSKLNPLKGLGRLFGLDNLAAFLKSLVKLVAVCAVTWWVLRPQAAALPQLAALDVAAVLPFSLALLKGLLIAVLIVFGVAAGLDWMWQRHRFLARLRMSREELKQESKDTDGDPLIRGKLKQQRIARAKKRMTQAVPKATVVVMNPTHYAVALRYRQGEDAAPVCVAKGVDSLALTIRRIAEENAVPVVEDAPLARTLYAALDVDDSIPREHYEAVAKVIGFVLNGGRRAGALGASLPPRAPIRPASRPEATL